MSQVSNKSSSKFQRSVAAISVAALAMVSVFGVSSSASASEMAPVIEYDGNNLANSFLHSQFGFRPVQGQVGLDSTPLNRAVTTNQVGYTFGGWSYSPGEAAVTTLQTVTHTTTRMFLYAVWNTKVNLNPNGGTGAPASLDYRFASNLALPLAPGFKKKGYAFAGWSNSPASNVLVLSYRATADAVGNPTVYAVWKKTINFVSKGSTGAVPAPVTIFEGGAGVALPTAAQVSLTRAGYNFMGWSTTPRGKVVKNSASYLPKRDNVTLYAVWKKS